MTRKALLVVASVGLTLGVALAFVLPRVGPVRPREGDSRVPAQSMAAESVLDQSRTAILHDDWNTALAKAQEALAEGGLAARFQVEIARQRAATRGAEWSGQAQALGTTPDDAVVSR